MSEFLNLAKGMQALYRLTKRIFKVVELMPQTAQFFHKIIYGPVTIGSGNGLVKEGAT